MEKRRNNITGYSDKTWERKGHKRRFQRMASIIQIVAAFASADINIEFQGPDQLWRECTTKLHAATDCDGIQSLLANF